MLPESFSGEVPSKVRKEVIGREKKKKAGNTERGE
jgi:hypothetical protein